MGVRFHPGVWLLNVATATLAPSLALGTAHATRARTASFGTPVLIGSSNISAPGIAEPEPGVVLLAYDKIGKNRVGNIQKVYSVRIAVS